MKRFNRCLQLTGFLFLFFLMLATSCKKDFERLLAVETTGINKDTYTVTGAVTDIGESSPTYGFCYGTSPNPTLGNQVVTLGRATSPLTFQKTLIDLTPGATYYVRSFVQGEQGTVYGAVLSFEVTGNEVDYIYDDGEYDYGWRSNPGYINRMGNQFPVTGYGSIRSISLYFALDETHGSDQVNVEVFNSSRGLVGSTIQFVTPVDSWITISGLNIDFSGAFYVMVLWNNVSGNTNYLGEDQDGSQAYLNLAYKCYQDVWTLMSDSPNGNQLPGNFMIRVKAMLYAADGKQVIKELDASDFAGEKQSIPAPVFYNDAQPSDTFHPRR